MKSSHHIRNNMHFLIKENSLLARVAALKLGEKRIAMVMGKTIHLHNCTSEEFLNNETWLRHELVHIRQFREHGFLKFIILYLMESIRHGYYNNKFEIEARNKLS